MNQDLKTNYRIFAVCVPGLEDVLESELSHLGIMGKKTAGGVEFKGDLLTIYSVNLWLRTAARILVRIGSFYLKDLKKAVERFERYPWEIYLGKAKRIRIRASCHKSRIYHSKAISERLLKGIEKRLGRQMVLSSEDNETSPLVFIRLFKDRCILSVDSSGRHLHKRGIKPFSVTAPLRENLAAAMLLASGYDGSLPLMDPFCGSATIPIEAALIAARIPPGLKRRFGFMEWSNFDKSLWSEILIRSEQFKRPIKSPIVGIDKSEGAINAAIQNLKKAGLQDDIGLFHSDFLDFKASPSLFSSKKGYIVTNPPYGKRVKENYGLLEFYSRLSQKIKNDFKTWELVLILPKEYPSLKKTLSMPFKRITTFSNGGIKVELLRNTI